MKINKKNLIKIILTLVGFFWFIFSCFLIFRNREHTYQSLILLFYFMFTVQIFILFRKSENLFIKILIENFLKIKNEIYDKPLENLFNNVIKPLPYIGNVLMFFCKGIIYLYIKLKFYSIRIACVLFYILPNVMLILIIFFNVFFSMHLYKILIITLVFNRGCHLLFYVLLDFCHFNKTNLEKYLIIREVNSQIMFDLNNNTVKDLTQKKLDLYAKQYMLFLETERYLLTTKLYYGKNIKGYLSSFFFSILFSCSLKIILYTVITTNIYYIIFFLMVLLKELKNNKLL